MRKIQQVAGIVLFVWAAVGLQGASPAQTVTATAELESWNKVTRELSEFCLAMDISTAPLRFNDLGSSLLHLPNLAGVDVDRPIRFFLVRSPAPFDPPGVVVRVPLSNREAALEALRGEHGEPVEEQGVWTFGTSPGKSAPALRFTEDPGAVFIGNRANLVDIVARSDIDALWEGTPALSGSIRATVHLKSFWPFAEMMLAMTMKRRANSATQGQGAGQAIEWKPLLDLFRGLEKVSLGLDVDAAGIAADFRMESAPGSVMAEIFERQRPASPRYAAFLPTEAPLGILGGGMDAFARVAEPYRTLIESMLRGSGMTEDQVRGFRDVWGKAAANYSGDYAVGIFDDPRKEGNPVFVSAYAVRDSDAALRQIREAAIMKPDWIPADIDLPHDLIVPAGDREYRGDTVYMYKFKISEGNPKLPVALREWVDGLVIEACVSGRDMVTCVGAPGSLDALIDRLHVPAGGRFPQQVTTRFDFPKREASEYFRLSPVVLTRAWVTRLSGIESEDVLSSLPQPAGGIGAVQFPADAGLHQLWRLPIAACRNFRDLGKILHRLGSILFMPPAAADGGGAETGSGE